MLPIPCDYACLLCLIRCHPSISGIVTGATPIHAMKRLNYLLLPTLLKLQVLGMVSRIERRYYQYSMITLTLPTRMILMWSLKSEYTVLLNKHNCKEQETYIVQDQPLPPSETLLLPPLESLYKVYNGNQELPQPGDSRPSCHHRNIHCPSRWWRNGRFGRKTLPRLRIKECWSKWPFMRHK